MRKHLFTHKFTPIYQEVLNKYVWDHKLKYQKKTSKVASKQQRKRKITWLNPPYSMSVSTNLGHYFLNLVNKHFPLHHRFSKIFNPKLLKVSSTCMPNMKSRISIHNKTVANQESPTQERTCDCKSKSNCPLSNMRLSNTILCKANITSTTKNYKNKIHYGINETKFKPRYANHRKSFKSRKYKALNFPI